MKFQGGVVRRFAACQEIDERYINHEVHIVN